MATNKTDTVHMVHAGNKGDKLAYDFVVVGGGIAGVSCAEMVNTNAVIPAF